MPECRRPSAEDQKMGPSREIQAPEGSIFQSHVCGTRFRSMVWYFARYVMFLDQSPPFYLGSSLHVLGCRLIPTIFWPTGFEGLEFGQSMASETEHFPPAIDFRLTAEPWSGAFRLIKTQGPYKPSLTNTPDTISISIYKI